MRLQNFRRRTRSAFDSAFIVLWLASPKRSRRIIFEPGVDFSEARATYW